jgi:osmotically-inducible protein OsmY
MKHLVSFFSATFLTLTLITAVGCASTPTQEGSGEYVDDSVITTKVKALLFDESNLKSGQIDVDTFKGVVQLNGFVSSGADIDRAIAIVRSIGGVKSVKNDLRVR